MGGCSWAQAFASAILLSTLSRRCSSNQSTSIIAPFFWWQLRQTVHAHAHCRAIMQSDDSSRHTSPCKTATTQETHKRGDKASTQLRAHRLHVQPLPTHWVSIRRDTHSHAEGEPSPTPPLPRPLPPPLSPTSSQFSWARVAATGTPENNTHAYMLMSVGELCQEHQPRALSVVDLLQGPSFALGPSTASHTVPLVTRLLPPIKRRALVCVFVKEGCFRPNTSRVF
jgi:hypothetical protein